MSLNRSIIHYVKLFKKALRLKLPNEERGTRLLLDEEEYLRWFNSALRTLSSARGDLERGDYNWACFKAQQAAELAVKALLRGLGLSAYGHSVSRLLREVSSRGVEAPSGVVEAASSLDKLYVPTRYPNAWAEGSPHEYYTRSGAENALNQAKDIVEWIERSWRSLKSEGGLGSGS